ncbi:MAG: hypothetical protein ACRDJT_01720 [Actinomycetota bacterium]
MKRVICLLTSCLILSWAFSGPATAQSLTGPLDKVVDEVKEPVDQVKEVVKEPVDQVVKDATEVAKVPSGSVDKPQTAPALSGPTSAQSEPANSASGASVAHNNVARATKPLVMSSKNAKRGGPEGDTEEVVSAGNMIEPAQVKGAQIITPATEVDESEGSGLSRTGVQILTWLTLAGWLLGAGWAFFWRGRSRVRVATS